MERSLHIAFSKFKVLFSMLAVLCMLMINPVFSRAEVYELLDDFDDYEAVIDMEFPDEVEANTSAIVSFEDADPVLGGFVPGPTGNAPGLDGIFGSPGGLIPSMGYTAEYAMLILLVVLFVSGAIGYKKVKKQQELSKGA